MITRILTLIFCLNTALCHAAVSDCDLQTFNSKYYLVDVGDINTVSIFYRQLSDEYFENLENYSRIVGRRTRQVAYYDSPNLALLANGMEISHILDKNLPNYREDKEKIIYRQKQNGTDITSTFLARTYKNKKEPLDKHPLLGLIKRKDRPGLMGTLESTLAIKPTDLKKTLTVDHNELVYLIEYLGITVGEIVLDEFHIHNYGVPNTSFLIKLNFHKTDVEALKPGESQQILDFFCKVDNDLNDRIPTITSKDQFGYSELSTIANEILPTRLLFLNYPMLVQLIQIILLSFIGFLFLYLLIGRYSKRTSFRSFSTTKNINRND